MAREEAFPAHHFEVEIAGIRYNFRSVTGLKSERTVVELDEGGFNNTTRKLMGNTKHPNLVLKHGFLRTDSELYRLRQKFQLDIPGPDTGKTTDQLKRGWNTPNRFSGTISVFAPGGRIAKYGFAKAWIVKWEGPDADASKNEVAVESIEIAHAGLFPMTEAQNLQSNAQSAPPAQAAPPAPTTVDNFATGSSEAPPSEGVNQTGQYLAQNPDKRCRVEGYTDNVGSAASNKALSQSRAESVRSQLIAQGAKPDQVTAIGYGEENPKADNSTAAGRAQNRRVEVIPE